MGHLETAQRIWEKSTEVFNKIENKKEWFNNLIDNLESDSSINRIKDKRNSMTEEQKSELYKRNAITVSEYLKRWSPLYQIYSAISNWIKNTKELWWKNALKYAFLEQIPCRFFVELWILQKPKSLTKEKLIDDIKRDAKNFNIYLRICETVCKAIPQARKAAPLIWIARHYTKWYKDHWTEILTDRLNNKEKINIKEQTNKELSNILSDNNEKKAA